MAGENNLRLEYWETPNDNKITYRLDFVKISTIIPFGIERFDIAGDTRKTVQQTKGIEESSGNYRDQMYVDTWFTAPNTITLAGVVKFPEANDTNYAVAERKTAGREFAPWETFVNAVEDFYVWNSSPMRINRGDYVVLYDFMRRQKLKVTIKSRRLPMSVDRPSLIPFEINLIVLETIGR